MKESKIIILFGRSGCGKGTQADLLIEKFGFEYLSTGELLRERKKQDDFVGRRLGEAMAQGELVPTFLVFQIWSQQVEAKRESIDRRGLIVDGSPRKLKEAEWMDEVFDWYGWKNISAGLIDISEQEAFDRLTKRRQCEKCGRLIPWVGTFKDLRECDQCGGRLIARADDHPDAIKERMAFFKESVGPAIEYYEKQGRLVKVNGEQGIEAVQAELIRKLGL